MRARPVLLSWATDTSYPLARRGLVAYRTGWPTCVPRSVRQGVSSHPSPALHRYRLLPPVPGALRCTRPLSSLAWSVLLSSRVVQAGATTAVVITGGPMPQILAQECGPTIAAISQGASGPLSGDFHLPQRRRCAMAAQELCGSDPPKRLWAGKRRASTRRVGKGKGSPRGVHLSRGRVGSGEN